MKNVPPLSKLPIWIDALWLGLLSLYILAGAAIVPFHGDESTQISMGRDYYYIFVDGDFSRVFYDQSWSTSRVEQHLRLVNGTISKTIHGWLATKNGIASNEINSDWDWQQDYVQNRGENRVPQAELLRQARLASALQLSLAVALFFVVARITISRPVAFLASGLLALHPTVLVNGRRAMMEGSHVLGIALVLLAAIWLMQSQRWWKYLLLGISGGFAIAAKHPNAFVVAAVFLACGSLSVFRTLSARGPSRQKRIKPLAGLAAAALVSLLVFYFLNPAWWQAPLSAASEVLTQRIDLLQRQLGLYGGYLSNAERAEGFFKHVFMSEMQYYEVDRWAGYDEITAQIKAYESSGWSGAAIGGSQLAGVLNLTLTLLGIGFLLRDRRVCLDYRWLLLFWGGGISILTFLVTPLSWTRYYLPILPFVALMSANSIVALLTIIWARITALVNDLDAQD